ncbi:enoyl-CoA hydratase/isomerase family protein [Streptomyces sp. NPDC046931]|uniref:enoyl-CoA hydratase/isomerase family protein n=1 Tax=Streptomyces sp. NPDC046931 TaxID=3154806 RepID=UPI0033D543BD
MFSTAIALKAATIPSAFTALVHDTTWLFLLLLALAAFAAGLWRTVGVIRGCLTIIGLMITADLAPDVHRGLVMAGWIATGTGIIVGGAAAPAVRSAVRRPAPRPGGPVPVTRRGLGHGRRRRIGRVRSVHGGGHTFAAGAMFSLAHDFRVMRADRGFRCLPEADINVPFTPGMCALIQSRLAPQTAHEAMVTGRRYGGSDAAAAGIVDRAVEEDAVLSTAVEIAEAQLSKAGDTLGTIKARMDASALATLRDAADPLG